MAEVQVVLSCLNLMYGTNLSYCLLISLIDINLYGVDNIISESVNCCSVAKLNHSEIIM